MDSTQLERLPFLKLKKIPYSEERLDNIWLPENELQKRCFIANGTDLKKGRAHPYYGADVSSVHISYLCDFDRFTALHILKLSNNFLQNIEPLSCCLNLVWLDIHKNHVSFRILSL